MRTGSSGPPSTQPWPTPSLRGNPSASKVERMKLMALLSRSQLSLRKPDRRWIPRNRARRSRTGAWHPPTHKDKDNSRTRAPGWRSARSHAAASHRRADSGLRSVMAARAVSKSPAAVSASDVQNESRPKNHAKPGRLPPCESPKPAASALPQKRVVDQGLQFAQARPVVSLLQLRVRQRLLARFDPGSLRNTSRSRQWFRAGSAVKRLIGGGSVPGAD